MFRFIIRFLKVLSIACIISVGLRVVDVIFYKQKTDEIDKQIASEIIAADSSEESNSQPIDSIVITEEQKEVKQEEKTIVKENKEAGTVAVKPKETVETKQQTKQETVNAQTDIKQEQKPTTQETENKQDEQIQQEEIKKEDIKAEEQEEEEKQEETKVEQEQQEQIITEEYKINEEMIDRIRIIIENNETADMKNYGYEIVPDSTIPELTNEFTFTEQRVINKITWKSGIIRIYARDYYFNGNYISTQCFII